MRRIRLCKGKQFRIYSIERTGGSRPFREFLTGLEKADRAKVIRLIRQVAENGPPMNAEKSRAIQGESNLYELKSSQVRIMYFYAPGGIIVLTHGFMKQSGPPVENEIARAKRLRKEYLDTYGHQ